MDYNTRNEVGSSGPFQGAFGCKYSSMEQKKGGCRGSGVAGGEKEVEEGEIS